MSDITEIRRLEEVAANAWPAAVVQFVDGWRLRFNWGITQRANSVWANHLQGGLGVTELLATAEAFYSCRHARPMFQISPASEPTGLDDLLAERGYQLLTPTAMQIAPTTTVLGTTKHTSDITVSSAPTISDRWSRTYAMAEGLTSKESVIRRGIMQRIGPPARFVVAEIDGTAVATGFGVLERNWLGIYSMTTQAGYRGRGAATAILHDLAAWAHQHNAGQVYLQVTQANGVALRLYQRLGFQTWYQYHYRQPY